MARDFATSIVEKRRPVSDGYAGYRVVRLLEAAQRSMTQNGRPVELSAPAASSYEAVSSGRILAKAVPISK